jgi:hypothetical protein
MLKTSEGGLEGCMTDDGLVRGRDVNRHQEEWRGGWGDEEYGRREGSINGINGGYKSMDFFG